MRLLYVAGCHQNQHHVQSHGAGLRAPAVRSGGGARPDGRDHPGDERADGDQTPERPALREPSGDGDSGRLLANHVLVLQIAGKVCQLKRRVAQIALLEAHRSADRRGQLRVFKSARLEKDVLQAGGKELHAQQPAADELDALQLRLLPNRPRKI